MLIRAWYRIQLLACHQALSVWSQRAWNATRQSKTKAWSLLRVPCRRSCVLRQTSSLSLCKIDKVATQDWSQDLQALLQTHQQVSTRLCYTTISLAWTLRVGLQLPIRASWTWAPSQQSLPWRSSRFCNSTQMAGQEAQTQVWPVIKVSQAKIVYNCKVSLNWQSKRKCSSNSKRRAWSPKSTTMGGMAVVGQAWALAPSSSRSKCPS